MGNRLRELEDGRQLPESQKKWSEVNKDTTSQSVLSAIGSEGDISTKEITKEMKSFSDYLSQDPKDAWWLSMMDDLLKKYPFKKIKGIYFYSKYVVQWLFIDASNIYRYLNDKDIKKDISLFSDIPLSDRKIIRQADEFLHIYIDSNVHSIERALYVLRSLTQEEVDYMKSEGGYYWSPLAFAKF